MFLNVASNVGEGWYFNDPFDEDRTYAGISVEILISSHIRRDTKA
jgi:hypothetical protein